MGSNFDLADAIERLNSGASEFEIPNEQDVSEDADGLLEEAVEAVAESSDAITKPEIFDLYCSFLKHSEVVSGAVMNKLLDSVTSGLSAQVETAKNDIEYEDQQTYRVHKAPLELYAFLLQWFAQAAEKVKSDAGPSTPVPKARRGRGGKSAGSSRSHAKKNMEEWSWVDSVAPTLDLITRLLQELPTQRLWTTTTERDRFIDTITRPAYQVAENEAFMKPQTVRRSFSELICHAVKSHNHGNTAQIMIMQRLQYHEYLADPMAECLALLAKKYDHTQLGEEVLREISQKEFPAQDTKTPRIFARFLLRFAHENPRSMLKQLPLVIALLDSESYAMRNALVELMGILIFDLAAEIRNESAEDPEQSRKNILGMYKHLRDRMLDNSGYVRAKVLSVLNTLCNIDRPMFADQRMKMTKVAIIALEDKVSTVRKNAAALLVKLMITHPYSFDKTGKPEYDGKLKRDDIERDYTKKAEKLKALREAADRAVDRVIENVNEGEEEEDRSRRKSKKSGENDMDVDGEDEEATDEEQDEEDEDSSMIVDENGQPSGSKRPKLKPRKSRINLEAIHDDEALRNYNSAETQELEFDVKLYRDCLEFITRLEVAMEVLEQMLGSKNKAEVLEAIEFFRFAYHRELTGAEQGLRKMVHLIWHKDNSSTTSEDGKELKGIRGRLLETFEELYIKIEDGQPRNKEIQNVTKNLIWQTMNATLADLTSLEELLRVMMEKNIIADEVIDKLWAVFSVEKNLPKDQRKGAIIILGMLALAKRSILTDKVDVMLKVGLGKLGREDLTLARYTCVALQRLAGSTKKIKGSVQATRRIEMDNAIFRKVQTAIERPCRSKEWFGLAEQAINTIYALGQQPDALCGDIIKKMTVRVFSPKEPSTETQPRDPDAMDEDAPAEQPAENISASQGRTQVKADSFELAQLLFVVGHVAIKQIAYLEIVEREMKRRKDTNKGSEAQAANKEAEELDQVTGANAEDEIADDIKEVREIEMLHRDTLLAKFGQMLVNICGSPHIYKSRVLRAAATLSLSKFLCVSPQFCEENYRLLFKILDTSKSPGVRSNVVIALGDVAVSFSNIIDENSNELYKGLSDKEAVVKKNTLMVLTHLILNGMIKVKGQLGEMAKCVEDEDVRIADLAKLFFQELSTKDNAIYNNLPDIISHLSAGEHAVDEQVFQKTLKYIFTFIEKEKQAESIVEKLCQRFRLTDEPRQWRDIAFCLSLLPYKSEKSVKKLVEGLPNYRDKLHEQGVYDRFQEILAKARLAKSKNDIGTEVKDFEEILEEHRRQGQDDQELEKRAKGKKAQVKKRATRKNAARGARAAPKQEREEEEDAGGDGDDGDAMEE